MRAVDTPIRVGDARTAGLLLEWYARTDLSSTLASVLDYYRELLKQSVSARNRAHFNANTELLHGSHFFRRAGPNRYSKF